MEQGVVAAAADSRKAPRSPALSAQGASMKPRHVPLRTCVVCKDKKPKQELLRIVRKPDGEVQVDAGGKLSGRGGYICSRDHWGDRHIRAKLGHALKVQLAQEDIDRLSEAAGQAQI